MFSFVHDLCMGHEVRGPPQMLVSCDPRMGWPRGSGPPGRPRGTPRLCPTWTLKPRAGGLALPMTGLKIKSKSQPYGEKLVR